MVCGRVVWEEDVGRVAEEVARPANGGGEEDEVDEVRGVEVVQGFGQVATVVAALVQVQAWSLVVEMDVEALEVRKAGGDIDPAVVRDADVAVRTQRVD